MPYFLSKNAIINQLSSTAKMYPIQVDQGISLPFKGFGFLTNKKTLAVHSYVLTHLHVSQNTSC